MNSFLPVEDDSTPILIVGGGPVGMVLALALRQKNIPVKILESRAKGAAYADGRALALSNGSKLILQRLGVWETLSLKATPIKTIHISQRGSLGRSKLKASEHQMEALGYVLSYGDLSRALDLQMDMMAEGSQIQLINDAIVEYIEINKNHAAVHVLQNKKSAFYQCPLVVVADGGRSLQDIPGITRETKEYGHDALVTKVSATLAHHNVAYERFTPAGPMALLPNGERDFSLVWTGEKAAIEPLLMLDDAAFLQQLHANFGDRVGAFLTVEKRMSFPLKLSTINTHDAEHLVIIGNAAQTMHPVAGQGFNIGLRDAWNLAEIIASTNNEALGSKAMLQTYVKTRARDTKGGVLFTDFLVNVFSNDILGFSPIRGAALGVFEIIKPLKSLIVNKMSFGK